MLSKKAIDKRLKGYIREHLGKGYSKKAVSRVLAEHGYDESYVEGLIKKHAELKFVKKYAVLVSLLFVILMFSLNFVSTSPIFGDNLQEITGNVLAAIQNETSGSSHLESTNGAGIAEQDEK